MCSTRGRPWWQGGPKHWKGGSAELRAESGGASVSQSRGTAVRGESRERRALRWRRRPHPTRRGTENSGGLRVAGHSRALRLRLLLAPVARPGGRRAAGAALPTKRLPGSCSPGRQQGRRAASQAEPRAASGQEGLRQAQQLLLEPLHVCGGQWGGQGRGAAGRQGVGRSARRAAPWLAADTSTLAASDRRAPPSTTTAHAGPRVTPGVAGAHATTRPQSGPAAGMQALPASASSPSYLISKTQVSKRSCQACAPTRSVASMNAVPSLLPCPAGVCRWGEVRHERASAVAQASRNSAPAVHPHSHPSPPSAASQPTHPHALRGLVSNDQAAVAVGAGADQHHRLARAARLPGAERRGRRRSARRRLRGAAPNSSQAGAQSSPDAAHDKQAHDRPAPQDRRAHTEPPPAPPAPAHLIVLVLEEGGQPLQRHGVALPWVGGTHGGAAGGRRARQPGARPAAQAAPCAPLAGPAPPPAAASRRRQPATRPLPRRRSCSRSGAARPACAPTGRRCGRP